MDTSVVSEVQSPSPSPSPSQSQSQSEAIVPDEPDELDGLNEQLKSVDLDNDDIPEEIKVFGKESLRVVLELVKRAVCEATKVGFTSSEVCLSWANSYKFINPGESYELANSEMKVAIEDQIQKNVPLDSMVAFYIFQMKDVNSLSGCPVMLHALLLRGLLWTGTLERPACITLYDDMRTDEVAPPKLVEGDTGVLC
jgi:hypothetical protein